MPNIHLYGYEEVDKPWELHRKITDCMLKIGLGEEAITTVHRNCDAVACDGSRKSVPYLHIFSSEIMHIQLILAGFQAQTIHENVEVISEKVLFFTKEEIASGSWQKKFKEKTGLDIKDILL